MEEKTKKAIKKTIEFKKSGEILSVEVCLDNISPQLSKKGISDVLDELFEEIKATIF